ASTETGDEQVTNAQRRVRPRSRTAKSFGLPSMSTSSTGNKKERRGKVGPAMKKDEGRGGEMNKDEGRGGDDEGRRSGRRDEEGGGDEMNKDEGGGGDDEGRRWGRR
ncbi:hypothetical protein LINGRAHAP2_LOCUS12942, partial [Linum grandiflorum]